MTAHVETPEVKSGAAGAKKFPGWNSRKYNYFEPKGSKAEAYSVVPGSSPDDGSAAFEVCAPS